MNHLLADGSTTDLIFIKKTINKKDKISNANCLQLSEKMNENEM